LGSTYRTIQEYKKAKKVLAEVIGFYPDHLALKFFLSIKLNNLQEYEKGLEM